MHAPIHLRRPGRWQGSPARLAEHRCKQSAWRYAINPINLLLKYKQAHSHYTPPISALLP